MLKTLVSIAAILVAATHSEHVVITFCSDYGCKENCQSFTTPADKCWQVPRSMGLGNASFDFSCKKFQCFTIKTFFEANCPTSAAAPVEVTGMCNHCEAGISVLTVCDKNKFRTLNCPKPGCSGKCKPLVDDPWGGELGTCSNFNQTEDGTSTHASMRVGKGFFPCYEVTAKHASNSHCGDPNTSTEPSGSCSNVGDHDKPYMISFTCAAGNAPGDLPLLAELGPDHWKALAGRMEN